MRKTDRIDARGYYRKIILFSLLCFFGSRPNAQQSLNFNFEKTSVDPVKPWGWDYWLNGRDMQGGLDSIIRHSGRFSAVMKSKDSNDTSQNHSFVTWLEPYQLNSQNVRLDGWVRSEKILGNVFVILTYDWEHGGAIESRSDTSKIDVSSPQSWKNFSIQVKMPARLIRANLTLYQSGAGVIWFDDFDLTVNGKKLTNLQVAKPFSGKQMKWLSASSSPVLSVDATAPNERPDHSDLKAFKELAGDAKIIGVGEATHGTSEFFRLKHRLLEYAVKEMGVRVFGIEDHQMVLENVNGFVLNGTGDARKSMNGMFSVWDSQEVLNMIKWVRAYNLEHPDDKIEFLGFDMQAVVRPLDSLFAFLQRKEPVMYATVSGLLSGLKDNGAKMYLVNDSTKRLYSRNAQKALDLLIKKRAEWLSTVKTKEDTAAIEWGIQYARLVQQFAQENINPMDLHRDFAMAENVSWILSMRKPGTKILIWAHDVHISRGDHPTGSHNYHKSVSMGSWLSKKYGSEYKAFGISTFAGEYRAYPSYSNYSKWISCPVFPGPAGSLDEALHQIAVQKKTPAILLNLKDGRKLKWLADLLPVRFANHVCFEYAYWTRFSIPYQFDGIFFVDMTTGANPIRTN